ncbi:protein-disulfide reductase DsbD domain-containing protein [Chitinophaga defluvii]|uniref:Protein-disulfide reductase DsbD domain-containing protein n=1 Tax=Chitinophaga defluvii TaxID=3163343 RepID=A0ABV2TBE4_9BACT
MITKSFRVTFLAIGIAGSAFAQIENPVKWHFSAQKKGARVYELNFTPEVSQQWHIYSQSSAPDGPSPTTIRLDSNPLVLADSSVSEHGTVVSKYEDLLGLTVKYFKGPVNFVQTVRVKAKAKTKVTGTVEYMACKEEQCLPPQKINFSIMLE